MTEQEWLVCTDPRPMLDFMQGKASDRKLRLFASGCCHQFDAFLFIPEARTTRPSVLVAEQFADGWVTEQVLDKAWRKEDRQWDRSNSAHFKYYVVKTPAFSAAKQTASHAHSLYDEYEGATAAAKLLKAQSDLMRCIFGNPFRPLNINPGLKSVNVVAVAQTIYDDRRFDELPVLGDALIDAGCTSEDGLTLPTAG
jgi:hypothetical protein